MKRIGITANSNFPIDEWSKQSISMENLFESPINLTPSEIRFAHLIMDTIQLDKDDNEGLIEFICKPSDFMSFLVHLKRIIHQYEVQSND
jgi:hypothetical protein